MSYGKKFTFFKNNRIEDNNKIIRFYTLIYGKNMVGILNTKTEFIFY